MRFKPLLLTFLFFLFFKITFAHSGGVWVANDGCGHWYAIVFHYHNNSSAASTTSTAKAGLYIDFDQSGFFDVNGVQYAYTDVGGFTNSNNEFNRFTDWINLTDKSTTATAYVNDPVIKQEVLNWLNTNKNFGKSYTLTVVADGGNSSSTWYEALVVPIKPLSPGLYKASTSTSSATETPVGYTNPFTINYTPSNFIGTVSSQSSCGETLKINTSLTQTCVQEYGVVYSTTNQTPSVGAAGVTQQIIWTGPGTDMVNKAFEYSINVPAGNEYKNYYARAYYKQQVGSELFYVYSPLIQAIPLDPNLDCDGDGISNGLETAQPEKDTDGDGIPDFKDLDSDGDGIPDSDETGTPDCDEDGIPDFQDLSLAPDIKNQPVNAAICFGSNATFKATVTGGGLSYRWQVDTNDGAGFKDINNNAVYGGVTTNTLTITKPAVSFSGYKYRVVINSSSCNTSSTSAEAFLTLNFTNPPSVSNVSYIVTDQATALSSQVTSGFNLLWYTQQTSGVGSVIAPVPPTTTIGSQDYWVSQTLNGCESERAKITVTITPTNEMTGSSDSRKSYFPQAAVVDDQITVTGKNVTNAKVFVGTGFQANKDVLISGTLPSGVTSSYNSATGILTFTGTASAAQWQTIFRGVKFSSTSENTADRVIQFGLGDAVSLKIDNKTHYYQYIAKGTTITWKNAKIEAEGRTFFGLTGYLATITSQTENDFIKNKLLSDGWVGGTDDPSVVPAAWEGNWYWASGPEAGMLISKGNNNPVLFGPYMNWNPGEPNNSPSEHYMQLYSTQNGKWNDLANNSTAIQGYVVEYGGYASTTEIKIESSRTLTFYTPAVPSMPVLTEGNNGYTNDNTPRITGTAEPNVQVHVYNGSVLVGTVTADADGKWSYTFGTALADATYQISASATDIDGFTGNKSTSLTIKVDTQKPTVPSIPVLADGNNGHTKDNTPTVSGTAEPNSEVTVYADGTAVGTVKAGSDGRWTYTFAADLADGDHKIKTTATDAAGNVSDSGAELTIKVDTQKPSVPSTPILAGGNDGNIGTGKPTVSGTAEPNSEVTVYAEGIAVGTVKAGSDGRWTYTFAADLADGDHKIKTTATDAAGNISDAGAELTIKVDTQKPSVPSSPVLAGGNNGNIGTGKPTVSGTAEPNSEVTVYADGTAVGTVKAGSDGKWIYTFAADLADGDHKIKTTATDAAGNVSDAGAELTIKVDTQKPSVPSTPVLAGGNNGNTGTGKPTVSGTAEPNSEVTVYADGTAVGTVKAGSDGRWIYTFAANLADGDHKIKTTATDAAGNVSDAGAELTIKVDTQKPSVPSSPVLAGGNNGNIGTGKPTVSGTAEPNSEVTVYADGTAIGTVKAGSDGKWIYTFAADLADGDHKIKTTATDAAGNVSDAGAELTIKVDTQKPSVPSTPILAGGNDGNIGTGKPTVSGTAEPNSEVTVYADGTAVGTVKAGSDGKWTYTFAADLADGDHKIKTTATDAAGNVSDAGAELTIKVDTQKPSVPSTPILAGGNNGNIGTGKPTVSGTAEPNSEVTVYADGTAIGTVKAGSDGKWIYTFTTNLPDGSHIIKTDARDAAGNVSDASLIIINVDTQKPEKPGKVVVAGLQDGISYDNQPVLSGTTEPNTTVDIIINGVIVGTVTADASGNWQYKVNPVLPEGAHNLKTRTTDAAGNFSESDELNILIYAINQAPTLAAIADQTICTTTADRVVTLSGISGGREPHQSTTLTVTADNMDLFEQLYVSGTAKGEGSLGFRLKSGASGTAVVTVTVKDNGGTAGGGIDSFSQAFILTVNPLPQINISSNIGTEISKGQETQLTATGGIEYQWASANGIISGQNSAVLTVRPMETTTYTVTVRNANGCESISTITLEVKEDYMAVQAENFLTPNGDGVNDNWVIKNIDAYPNHTLSIYDRSGKELYKVRNYKNDWDGTFNGMPLAEGTYYYIIRFDQNQPSLKMAKGFITIVRSK